MPNQASSKNTIYKITLTNWDKHNPKRSKYYKYATISLDFFYDSKIIGLSNARKLAVIMLITECGRANNATITCSEHTLNMHITCRERAENVLSDLQSLHILTYEKISQNKNKNKKRIRIRKELASISEVEKNEVTAEPSAKAQKTKSFIANYCRLFFERYKENPEITGRVSGIAKRIASELSENKSRLYLEAFFRMPDPWLTKTKHPLAAFETKLNEIVVFASSGQYTSQREVNQSDDGAALANQLKRIREGKV